MKRPALPARAYERLVERDGEKCRDCGATGVVLEIEHNIPWWKARHLPPKKRKWYASLANLYLRCKEMCHKIKTRKEAAERAHYKRLRNRNNPDTPLVGKDGQRLT